MFALSLLSAHSLRSPVSLRCQVTEFYFEDRLYRTRAQELLLTRLFGDPDPARGADASADSGDAMDESSATSGELR